MAPLPPVRKRASYSDISGDELGFALFYDRIAESDALPEPAVKATDPTPDDPDVQRLANALRQYLRGEYKTASEAIAAMPEGILSSGAADQLPLDTGSEIAKILRRFYPLFVKAGWQSGADQIGVDLAFDLENPFVQQTLDSLASAIVGVSDTTRDEIRDLVGKQASEGWDMATLAAMIATRADVIAPERALTIARTESASAQSQGSILSWQASGVVDRVTWLTSDPCPICAPLDGKTVAIGQPFAPGVMHPPAHPNCRCALVAVLSATKATEPDDDALWDVFDAEEDAQEEAFLLPIDDDAVKFGGQARDGRGRFAASAGSAQRKGQRHELRTSHAEQRTALRERHAEERTDNVHDADQKARHKAERQKLHSNHALDRQGLRERHDTHRTREAETNRVAAMRKKGQDERHVIDAHAISQRRGNTHDDPDIQESMNETTANQVIREHDVRHGAAQIKPGYWRPIVNGEILGSEHSYQHSSAALSQSRQRAQLNGIELVGEERHHG